MLETLKPADVAGEHDSKHAWALDELGRYELGTAAAGQSEVVDDFDAQRGSDAALEQGRSHVLRQYDDLAGAAAVAAVQPQEQTIDESALQELRIEGHLRMQILAVINEARAPQSRRQPGRQPGDDRRVGRNHHHVVASRGQHVGEDPRGEQQRVQAAAE